MTQPVPYVQTTDFSGYQATNAAVPYNGSTHDTEFANIATSLTTLLLNMGLIQRDDGNLKNQIVTLDTLSQSVLNFLAAGSATSSPWIPRGAWATTTSYSVKDVVTQASSTYVCTEAHVSGTFATDLAAVKWLFLSAPPLPAPAFPSSVVSKSFAFIAGTADFGVLFLVSGLTIGTTVAFNAANSYGTAWVCAVRHNGSSGTVVINPQGAELVDGQTTRVLFPGESCLVFNTGTAWVTFGLNERPLLETLVASSSLSLDFSNGLVVGASSFGSYEFEFDNLLMSTTGLILLSRLSFDSGLTYLAAASSYWWMRQRFNVAGHAVNSNISDTAIEVCDTGVPVGDNVQGRLTLVRAPLTMQWDVNSSNSGGLTMERTLGNAKCLTSAPTNVRFYPDSGSLNSGTIRLYGNRKV